MIRALTPIATLLFGVAILLTGQGLQTVLLPVRANLESFSAFSIGIMGGAYFLGFTLGCWRGVTMIHRAGHVRVFAAMTAIASATPLLHGLWVSLGGWIALRLVSGFCFAVLYVVIESWLNERADNDNRGAVFSAYILINMTVLAVGQQLLLTNDSRGLQLFALTSVLISLAAVPLLMSAQQAPRDVAQAKIDFRSLLKNSPVGVFGTLASGINSGIFWSLAAVFVAAYSEDPNMAAWFMTSAIAGGAVSQWPLGWWSDRVDRRWVLVCIALLGTLVSLATWLLAPHLPMGAILGLGFAWGALAFPTYSISVAHANDWASPHEFVQVSAGLLLLYGIGAVIGPVLAPLLTGRLGASGLFLFNAVTFALLLVYTLARMRTRGPVDERRQQDFSDSLTAARTLSVVYEDEQDHAAEAEAMREANAAQDKEQRIEVKGSD